VRMVMETPKADSQQSIAGYAEKKTQNCEGGAIVCRHPTRRSSAMCSSLNLAFSSQVNQLFVSPLIRLLVTAVPTFDKSPVNIEPFPSSKYMEVAGYAQLSSLPGHH
jgi:hypothetical protein